MSEENVEIVRRLAQALNRRDLEGIVGECHPEVVWHPAMQALLGGEATTYRGHEGVHEMMSDFFDVFSEIHIEVSEVRDLGDSVIWIGRIRTRGQESGADTESPVGYVVDLADHQVIQVRTYLDPADALGVAGLSE